MAFYRLFSVFSLVFVVASSAQEAPRERKLYVGRDSTEATMTYSSYLEIKQSSVPTDSEIEEKLEAQVLHMFGPMGEAEITAVPKGEHKFSKISEPEKKVGARGTYIVHYKYKGTVVVQNKAKDKYTVILPINPDTIYEAAKVGNAKPCTDDHYDSEGDFWYFWSPDRRGCKLVEGEDYLKVEAELDRTENTTSTYPEYDQLIRNVDDENVIHMSVLFGMDDPAKAKNPLKSADINASNFKDVRNSLIKIGFKPGEPWSAGDIEKYFNANIDTNVYVEELVKPTKKAKVIVRMFFGPSGISEESEAFHYFFKDAIENSSFMAYDGHSGLGGHLDLQSIENIRGFKIKFPKDKYQILYFNSCTSYTYYNTQYFKRKRTSADPKGTKNMDILTNGLATYFSVMHETNMSVLKAITLYADGKGAMSYQALAKEIDSGNLFGINGDEDNSTTPPR